MFDVGFWELVLVALIALLVVGPERLPRLARISGMWLGRARRFLATVKSEIDQEIKAEELKQILEKQAMSNPLEKLLDEDTRERLRDTGKKTESALRDAQTGSKSE
jgi:sec-independent protein translocase protein TatB